MLVNQSKFKLALAVFFVSLFFVLPLSYLVAIREIGTDTENYRYSFYLFKEYGYISNEIGVYFFAWLTLLLGGGEELYFWFLFLFLILVLNLNYFGFFSSFSDNAQSESLFYLFYLAFLGFYFFSTWFHVVSLSVLRHGIALLLLYYSISHFLKGNVFKFILVFFLAALFHVSIILFLPFVFMINRSSTLFYTVFSLAAILYPIGVIEGAVELFSSLTGIPLYSKIVSYSEDNLRYYGFDYRYYVYTLFWAAFGFLVFKLFPSNEEAGVHEKILRVYCSLAMMLFVYGFASFSNRYGLFSWLFLPVLQVFLIERVVRTQYILHFLSFSLFLMGIASYLLFILQ